MLKKTIKYKDFTGEENTEDFYFNLTKAELIELEVSAEGNSLSDWLQKIVKAVNGAQIINTFKLIIDKSYGVKSPDGRRFIKSPELLAEFKSTMAYSDLFEELSLSAEKGSEFINGLMPEGMTAGESATQSQSSEAARRASEANLQGFRKPQPAPTATVERQPDLPVELQTAPPVLEPQPVANQVEREGNPQPAAQDINSMSIEQLRELATRQSASQ
jgi:hypothetical protein